VKLKLNPQNLKRAAINEFLPGILGGVVNGWLTNKTPQEFYNFVKIHAGQDWFSAMLNPKVQSKMRGMADDLKWLDIDWFVGAIVKEHRDIAAVIYSSELVKAAQIRQIDIIKEKLT